MSAAVPVAVLVVGRGRLGRALAAAVPGAVLVPGRAGALELGDALRTSPGVPAMLAVPDAALAEVAGRLAPLAGGAGRVALHGSGALAADASGPLGPLAAAGWHVGGLHPLCAVGADGGAAAVAGALAGISGEPEARTVARDLARRAGLEPFDLVDSGAGRVLYHAAASLVAGGAIALVDAALVLFARTGLPAEVAQRAAADLLRSAAQNAGRLQPADALTGPMARGDGAVLAAHLEALGAPGLAAEHELYRLGAERLLALVSARLPPQDVQRIAALVRAPHTSR
ncbi:MAG: DUF2520 domain-containing protein [Planctomycetaceae bacterium]|nr:DUF2520 domain-containing protein [Planctomycetaceae bacterium]